MRYFYLVFMSVLVVSCQQAGPSELEKYQSAKIIDNHELEQQFSNLVAQTIENQNNAPLSSETFAVSNRAIHELKETMAQLKESPRPPQTNRGNKKRTADPTPSTTAEELENLDSITHSQTSHLATTENKIKNGALLLNVRDYQDTYTRIGKLAEKYSFNIASEEEHTTDFHKGNTMEIYAATENFNQLIKEFRSLAVVIRKKHIWQQKDNQDFLRIQSQIATSKETIDNLNEHLAQATKTEDILRIQEELSKATNALDLMVLSAKTTISNKAYSTITLSFYQDLDMTKPAPETFSADFSSNLVVGWANFKQFLLDAALVWPYVILGLIFFITAALAVNNSRKKARQFKLQMLHGQNLQQQITQLKSTSAN